MSPARKKAPPKDAAAKPKTQKTTTKAASTKAKATKTAAKVTATKAKAVRKPATAEGKTLVIVESPSKAMTLNGILGKGYVVRSSKGHIRDLPKSRMAIDIEHDFAPEYILVRGKAELKNELLALARNASRVLLASDPDREGEAIAWHLADVLGVDLSERCRVRFYEITANAVRRP